MHTVYYSTVLDHRIDAVWSLVRDFNNYPVYIEGVTESLIEDGKSGDEVGAVRCFKYGDAWIRQKLSDHSDTRHTLSYVGLSPLAYPQGMRSHAPGPIRYEGTIALRPIIDGQRTFLEWPVSFQAAPGDDEPWDTLLMQWIPEWAHSLRRTLERWKKQD